MRAFVRCGHKQEAQLPQRDSASATHIFLGSLADRALHWTPHLYIDVLAKLVSSRHSQLINRATYIRTLSWIGHSFKVIPGYHCWCRQNPDSRTVCCHNVHLMPTLFLKCTKIRQRENGKFVDFSDPTRVLLLLLLLLLKSGITHTFFSLQRPVRLPLINTRKLSYRKDDRAMRPIGLYRCQENFMESLTTCTHGYYFSRNFYNGLLYRSILWMRL